MSEKPKISGPLSRGAQVIADYVRQLPTTPGVYRMISDTGEVLYVGKAKALKKRVVSYTHVDKLPIRLQRMVSQTATMEFVHTHTEVEALLLESNLIKKLKPRYNILLRDDKSFPYILITGDHDFAQVKKHRGARKPKGEYFGPFASAGAVNHTIQVLQRAFKLRNCSDNIFANRKRPCLQYHIKRCTAPCVDKVSKDEYADQVEQARQFLSGESRAIQEYFGKLMQKASEAEDFERAAEFRDRIKAMAAVQARQDINVEGLGDTDILALTQKGGQSCIQVFFFRGGQNFGNRAYFPRHDKAEETDTIMSVFMAQFYENKPMPKTILVNIIPVEKALLEQAFALKKDGAKVTISKPERGQRKRLIEFVEKNAADSLARRMTMQASEKRHLIEVQKLFGMKKTPTRVEVYDNSHISGTNQVGGMIVAGPEGFQKNAYRKFNIKTAEKSDDYGMMREVMRRRFSRALKEKVPKESEDWPDLLLIDGGQGQLSVVTQTLKEMGVYDDVTVVGIAKGPDRNAGREQFFMNDRKEFSLPINDPTLHYLQRLRDEVHRFAIGAHRTRRKNDISKSALDGIAGIGAKRKRSLLLHFGSAKDVASAGIEDLRNVDGISQSIAEKIYNHFNE
ncbi:MAG: excinuclease ABC subunit UvrC [Alphaproteobacteria bacterium]|nr:excinuclease ABC subunit UvrC [Alphaproteobacteria bacterium]NCQ88345.1 excinuclease ABC subunit UvrC [Alphaproteobacteria bacterium]NCT05169.1 excinuclease ABC subunit UvrC [Alphaproteobacteria bacterium]